MVQSCKLPAGTQVEWTGVLFPPLPWSPTTKKGMPQDIEERYHGKPDYTIINVPPVFMFKVRGSAGRARRLGALTAGCLCDASLAAAAAAVPNVALPWFAQPRRRQAKIFKPARLCTIYRHKGQPSE